MTNPDHKPVAVCAALSIDQMTGTCVNQPLNSSNAQGTPFASDITLIGADFVSPSVVDDQGKATATLCMDQHLNDYVQSYIDVQFDCGIVYPDYCSGAGICVNDNWWFERFGWTIDRLYIYQAAYQYDTKGNLVGIAPLCRMCTPGGSECGFSCVDMTDTSACVSKGLDTTCLDAVVALPK